MKIFGVLILTVILWSCTNSNQPQNTGIKKISLDTNKSKSNGAEKNNLFTDDSDPMDSTFSLKVLTTGTFHSDEVWKNAAKENWLGLFGSKTDFNISNTKLITTRVKDEIVDENEKTGWSVQTVTKEPCMLLFEESKFIQPKSVKQAILSQSQLFPGDTLKIKYLGNDYKLYATGIKKKNGDDTEWFEVMNYKLFLTTTIKGKNYKSLLAAQPNFDDNMITLIFAGDIDGDEILDLIIDTSRHYNVKNPTLYLSRPAKKGEIVKAVGSHKSVGC